MTKKQNVKRRGAQKGSKKQGGSLLGRLPRLSLPTLYDLVSWCSPGARRTSILTLGGIAACFSVYLFLFAPTGYLARMELEDLIEEKREVVADLEAEKRHLARQVELLKNDTHTIEAIARNELNMIKPGETLYRDPGAIEKRYALILKDAEALKN